MRIKRLRRNARSLIQTLAKVRSSQLNEIQANIQGLSKALKLMEREVGFATYYPTFSAPSAVLQEFAQRTPVHLFSFYLTSFLNIIIISELF